MPKHSNFLGISTTPIPPILEPLVTIVVVPGSSEQRQRPCGNEIPKTHVGLDVRKEHEHERQQVAEPEGRDHQLRQRKPPRLAEVARHDVAEAGVDAEQGQSRYRRQQRQGNPYYQGVKDAHGYQKEPAPELVTKEHRAHLQSKGVVNVRRVERRRPPWNPTREHACYSIKPSYWQDMKQGWQKCL